MKASGAGLWADAKRHFVRAAYLAPDQGLFWSNLAQAHRKLGDLPAAETAARRAVALDPSDLLARKLCGITLTEQHRYGEAVAVFAAHPPSAPRDHDYHCEYGQALYMLGRILESSRQFILSFTCKPDFVPAHARLSNAFARLGMHSEAAECLRTVELLQPWDAQALGNLIGNCVATVAVAAWEGDIDRERAHAVLDGRPGVSICDSLATTLDAAAAAVLVTRWEDFRALPELLAQMTPRPLLVDGRRMLDKASYAPYAGVGLGLSEGGALG